MTCPYRIRTVRFGTGERLPMLVRRSDGLPLFMPTVYSTTMLRQRNLASNTIRQALRSLMVLYLLADERGYDVEARIRDGEFLSLGDITALVTAVSSRIDESDVSKDDVGTVVKPATAASRLRYIRDYLSWLCSWRQYQLSCETDRYLAYDRGRAEMIGALEARIANPKGRNSVNRREGFSAEAALRIAELVDPESRNNPWEDKTVRVRNFLIIMWLMGLGIRRGELLGVMVPDIDNRRQTVLIARRPDNPDDPRRDEPNTKTRDRVLALDEDLLAATLDYVINVRGPIVKRTHARHKFLFIDHQRGRALSSAAISKMFVELTAELRKLRVDFPEIPERVSAHVLRHAWNDRLSEESDRVGMSPEDEKRIRNESMGWSQTSNTAADYLRRTIRRQAAKADLNIQKGIFSGNKSDRERESLE